MVRCLGGGSLFKLDYKDRLMRTKSLPTVSEVQTRREFLSDATVAAGLGILSVCGVGCKSIWTNHDVVVNVRCSASVLEINLESYPELKTPGGYLPVAEMTSDLRLIVLHSLEGQYLALSMSCTHQGADVELTKDKTGLVCPLHNSTFNLQGERMGGPARRNLATFDVVQNGSVLSIQLERQAT